MLSQLYRKVKPHEAYELKLLRHQVYTLVLGTMLFPTVDHPASSCRLLSLSPIFAARFPRPTILPCLRQSLIGM